MPASPIPFPDFVDRVYLIYSGPRYADATLGRMLQVLAELHALGITSTADLTTANMARYVASRPGLSPNTLNGYLGALAAACTLAIEEGWLEKPPTWRRLRLRETPGAKNRPPAYDQARRLLEHLGTLDGWEGRRLHALTWTFLLTGVRFREAVLAWVADVDLEGHLLHVNPLRNPRARLKTRGSDRTVPIPDVLCPVLARWIPETGTRWLFPGVRRMGPWVGGTTGTTKALNQLQHEAKAVGIERITWHSLRHAFGTFAVGEWGIPPWIVQQTMGHADFRTTQRYLHLKGSPRVREALAGIGFD